MSNQKERANAREYLRSYFKDISTNTTISRPNKTNAASCAKLFDTNEFEDFKEAPHWSSYDDHEQIIKYELLKNDQSFVHEITALEHAARSFMIGPAKTDSKLVSKEKWFDDFDALSENWRDYDKKDQIVEHLFEGRKKKAPNKIHWLTLLDGTATEALQTIMGIKEKKKKVQNKNPQLDLLLMDTQTKKVEQKKITNLFNKQVRAKSKKLTTKMLEKQKENRDELNAAIVSHFLQVVDEGDGTKSEKRGMKKKIRILAQQELGGSTKH